MHALILLMAAATPMTLRVDYFHTGDAGEERFSLDRVVVEPLPWPGNPARPVDDSNLGKYFFEVRDLQTQRILYSRGFCSIFGEWETTGEAKELHRTFHESLRFPRPTEKFQVVLKKRQPDLSFREVWALVLDPAGMHVDTSKPRSPGPLLKLLESGPASTKVDLLVLGDGYSQAERGKFEKDAKRLSDALFTYTPFRERKQDFNVWGLVPPAMESGISRPSTGLHRRSPLGATYDAFGAERYILTFDNRALRDVASFAPYDFVVILANNSTYGGGGIHNLYATVAADTKFASYVFVHELGHHLAGLADEYFTSAGVYEAAPQRLEPWEPNVTANPQDPKWKGLVAASTPLPTPWNRAGWEAWQKEVQAKRKKIRAEKRPESEMDAHFVEEQRLATDRLRAEPHAKLLGAFEGANYESQGYFRPQADCVMFTRNETPFCAPCRNALEKVFDQYTAAR